MQGHPGLALVIVAKGVVPKEIVAVNGARLLGGEVEAQYALEVRAVCGADGDRAPEEEVQRRGGLLPLREENVALWEALFLAGAFSAGPFRLAKRIMAQRRNT